ncbi:TlpA disulfide reductase family protein [uncultured Piscinibacter sp.]|uniref:TlpA disulfide reductase family protein n=1 Tax=uncultured Piscinibacter sp. TaxID=1131835 RepID=UPI0026127098|nr:TlpA disulfide reductase family protein [uncultured Piscinibacter sp.]
MDHAATPPFSPKRRRLLGAAMTAAGACALGSARAAIGGGAAPDFTLRTTAGSNMRLQEQRGQVVMVNFWATWCGPCKIEMPHLNRLYEKYRSSGFVLMGVNIDDDPRNAVATATKLGVTFPVLLDGDKRVSRLYDLSTMPTTLIIDRDGRLRHLHRGYREGYELTYDQQVRELLKS